MWQKVSFACACKIFVNEGGWKDCGEETLLSFFNVSSGACMAIASNGRSSLSGLVFSLFVASHDSAAFVYCPIPARCTTSKTNSDNLRRHWTSWQAKSAQLRIYFSAS